MPIIIVRMNPWALAGVRRKRTVGTRFYKSGGVPAPADPGALSGHAGDGGKDGASDWDLGRVNALVGNLDHGGVWGLLPAGTRLKNRVLIPRTKDTNGHGEGFL